ncbi:hypothetical protein [Streptomyces sp. LMG1-1-1.1]|uniref:hypothetical protein n=1 Tax=Streptomyces sp. LMG1-1-1.1 TaxID=3135245 RepID=UPI003467C76F
MGIEIHRFVGVDIRGFVGVDIHLDVDATHLPTASRACVTAVTPPSIPWAEAGAGASGQGLGAITCSPR